jgi:endonuclease/exonuclease/phosphatase family metal-dependent hydrolase
MREWLRVMVKLSIAEGAPVIYANFLGYDEQAHRRGPESAFAHWGLKGIDDVIGDVFRDAHASEVRDYEVLVLADHGQERARIYEADHGRTIQESVVRAFARGPLAGRQVHGLDRSGYRGSEMDQRARRLLRSRRGRVPPAQPTPEQLSEAVIVTALGPLGHVYLPIKLDDDELAEYARALVKQEHVPLVLYRDGAGVVRAQNRRGAWRLPEDAMAVFGPRHPFLEEAVADMLKLAEHPDAGDLILSGWNSEEPPVTFVQENGAHGSIGVDEVRGFALVPHALHVRRRRGQNGEEYFRGEDLHRAAWRLVHPQRPMASEEILVHSEPHQVEGSCLRPSREQARMLRVMTYNIHSCIGLDGKVRPKRIAQVIRSSRADVIALQEVDANRPRSRRHDQARVIAEALAMSHHYYAISDWQGEQYGLAIISRFPLEHVQSGHLTAADRARRAEARGALWVEVATPAGRVQVINTHFGLRREERLRQTEILLGVDWIGGLAPYDPVVLCGDMNAGPRSPVCRALASKLIDAQVRSKHYRPRATFLSTIPVRRLDHIFVSPHFEVQGVMLPRSPTAVMASDHLPVCVDLRLVGAAAIVRRGTDEHARR